MALRRNWGAILRRTALENMFGGRRRGLERARSSNGREVNSPEINVGSFGSSTHELAWSVHRGDLLCLVSFGVL